MLITDYQRSVGEPEQSARLPEGTVLTGIDVAEEESSNLSITTIVLQREAATDTDQPENEDGLAA